MRFVVVFLALSFCAQSPSWAQPGPGDVFREVTFNYAAQPGTHFSELDPNTRRDFSKQHTFLLNKQHSVPRSIELDLKEAVRAEMSVEFWGGHVGTSQQKFKINGHDWIDLPQPQSTPGPALCYYRTLLGNNSVPIPLAQLRPGTNAVQFAAGPQICYSFDFGFYWIYAFTIRVYYDQSKPHPTGRITAPVPGARIGDRPTIEAAASSPNSSVRQVDFIGLYEDFDWAGNGLFRQWHYQTRYGALERHIGAATRSPYRVVWDNQ